MILIFLVSYAIGIALMYFIMKEAVSAGIQKSSERTNTLLAGILEKLGGDPDSLLTRGEKIDKLNKRINEAIEDSRNGKITHEVYSDIVNKIENEKKSLK